MKKYNTIFRAFADISDKEKHNIALVVAKNKTIIGEVKEVYKCTDLDPVLKDVRLLAEYVVKNMPKTVKYSRSEKECRYCGVLLKRVTEHYGDCPYLLADRIKAATEEERSD